jgi:hypothetical protein
VKNFPPPSDKRKQGKIFTKPQDLAGEIAKTFPKSSTSFH